MTHDGASHSAPMKTSDAARIARDTARPSSVGHSWRIAKIRPMPHSSVRSKLQLYRHGYYDTITTLHLSEAAHAELMAALRRGLKDFHIEGER